jgi:hypothetical protein
METSKKTSTKKKVAVVQEDTSRVTRVSIHSYTDSIQGTNLKFVDFRQYTKDVVPYVAQLEEDVKVLQDALRAVKLRLDRGEAVDDLVWRRILPALNKSEGYIYDVLKATPKEVLLQQYRNAIKTYAGAGGHNKAYNNEVRANKLREEILRRELEVPADQDCYNNGVFNGDGSV